MPGLWLSQNSLRKAGSVAAFCVTANCIGVSFCFSSAAGGFWNFCIAVLVDGGEVTGGLVVAVCDAACEQPASPAAAKAAAAASKAIGFTGFMQDNSTARRGGKSETRRPKSEGNPKSDTRKATKAMRRGAT